MTSGEGATILFRYRRKGEGDTLFASGRPDPLFTTGGNVMGDVNGKWGLYPWFEEHGIGMIHPDDVDAMRELFPYGKVFECVEDQGGLLKLRYRDMVFRVRRELFKLVPVPPKKNFGDAVLFKKSGEVMKGEIYDIDWHYKNNEPFYLVRVGGKRLKKRYWARDFIDNEGT